MSESAQATNSRPAGLALPALLERHAFALGVAGIAAVAAAFLFHQLLAWQPHEDETLALFVGRQPLDQLFQIVLEERGGAPLHFLLAWVVAHLGFGLGGLRTVSALFAVASLPLVALLGVRLAGRRQALVATAVVGASWTFLFHGVYGRMYSLFLFTSLLSYLALLVALDRGDRRSWALWVLAILATVATHPYGGLVLATQGAYVLVARRDRLRQALLAGAAVVVLGTPFWLTNLVLADRFGVGVGGGGERLGGPWPVARYLWRVLGDFTVGWWPLTILALVLVVLGLRRLPRATVVLFACVVAVPALAFMLAQLGNATSPETRHLIFALPFVALAAAAGILRLGRFAPVALAALLVAQVAWTWERVPQLFEWEPDARQAARAEASSYLAATSRPGRRALRLRGALPRRLGAESRLPPRRPAAGGLEARTRDARGARPAPRTRAVDPGREQQQQLLAQARDPVPHTGAAVRLRGSPLRPVPRHPHQAADANAGALPRASRAGPAGRQGALHRRCGHQSRHGRTGAALARRITLGRLSLSFHELAVAGSLLEGGEPGRTLALPILGPQLARGRDCRGRPDGGADEEGAGARAAIVALHARIVV